MRDKGIAEKESTRKGMQRKAETERESIKAETEREYKGREMQRQCEG